MTSTFLAMLLLFLTPARPELVEAFSHDARFGGEGLNSAQSEAPDLIVKEILFEQSPAKIRVRVLNQGTGASSSCYLALQSMVGSNSALGTKQRVWTIQIPALEAGKGYSNLIDVSPLTQANGPWKAKVDRSNTVAESNEVNNSLQHSADNAAETTGGNLADLVIQSFRLSDPNNGEIAIVITNEGQGSAGGSTLRLIVWEQGQFEQKEAKTVFVKVRPLGPSHRTTVQVKAGVPIINTKYSMFIDISGEVAEADENNNRAEGDAGNFKP